MINEFEKEVLVTEFFESFQGEGPFIGKPCLFVRFYGCNNSCAFCDSKYSVRKDNTTVITTYKFNELVDKIKESKMEHIVFTGGEPLLQRDFLKYYKSFALDKVVEIETNGTIDASELLSNISVNVSPKLTNSGNPINEDYIKDIVTNIYRMYDRTFLALKFVVDTENRFKEDINEITEFLSLVKQKLKLSFYDLDIPIYLMPMGTDEHTIKNGIDVLSTNAKTISFPFMISPRLHVLVYGNKREV